MTEDTLNPKSFRKLALVRGQPPSHFDLVDVLMLFATPGCLARPLRGTWIWLDIWNQRLEVFSAFQDFSSNDSKGESSLVYDAKERCLIVPKDFTDLWGLPRITCSLMPGLMQGSCLDAVLRRLFPNEEVLHLGLCEWLQGKFVSTPMAHRLADNRYQMFVPSGGHMSLEYSLDNAGGVPLSEISPSADLGQALHAAVDLFRMRCRIPPSAMSALFCPCESVKDAINLVILRQAWGTLGVPVVLRLDADPAWRRLVQHLGAEPTLKTSAEQMSVRDFEIHIPRLTQDRLLEEINQHSRVIPEGILELDS